VGRPLGCGSGGAALTAMSGASARRVSAKEELPLFDLLLVFFVFLFGLIGRPMGRPFAGKPAVCATCLLPAAVKYSSWASSTAYGQRRRGGSRHGVVVSSSISKTLAAAALGGAEKAEAPPPRLRSLRRMTTCCCG
jgi:hypothetical protein